MLHLRECHEEICEHPRSLAALAGEEKCDLAADPTVRWKKSGGGLVLAGQRPTKQCRQVVVVGRDDGYLDRLGASR